MSYIPGDICLIVMFFVSMGVTEGGDNNNNGKYWVVLLILTRFLVQGVKI